MLVGCLSYSDGAHRKLPITMSLDAVRYEPREIFLRFLLTISQIVAEISRFFDFQNDCCPQCWICCACVYTVYEEHLMVLIFSAKFGWNWLCIILKMRVSMLCKFGLKMPPRALFRRRVFRRKIGENKLFLQFCSSRNAITPDLHRVNQKVQK